MTSYLRSLDFRRLEVLMLTTPPVVSFSNIKSTTTKTAFVTQFLSQAIQKVQKYYDVRQRFRRSPVEKRTYLRESCAAAAMEKGMPRLRSL